MPLGVSRWVHPIGTDHRDHGGSSRQALPVPSHFAEHALQIRFAFDKVDLIARAVSKPPVSPSSENLPRRIFEIVDPNPCRGIILTPRTYHIGDSPFIRRPTQRRHRQIGTKRAKSLALFVSRVESSGVTVVLSKEQPAIGSNIKKSVARFLEQRFPRTPGNRNAAVFTGNVKPYLRFIDHMLAVWRPAGENINPVVLDELNRI